MAERQSAPSGAPNREGAVSTFSFKVDNPLSQARPVSQGAPLRGGVGAAQVQGSSHIDRTGLVQAGAMASRDLDNLFRLGGAVLAKAAERTQDAAYWEGVKKAAVGSSIKQIVDEQPWYTKIFGDSPMVQGARAYTTQAKLDQTLAEFAKDMPELRKSSPNEVTQAFIGRLDAMMTGDPATDAVLKRSASEKLPLLLKQHASEHYAYLQTDLRKTQFESWQPIAAGLQAQAAGYAAGTVGDQDWKVIRDRAISALAPLEGQNEESYKSNILAAYSKAAQDGNFHMVKLLDEAGVRRFFTPEQQRTLDDQVFRYGQRAKAEYASQHMAEDLAALRAAAQTGQITPKDAAETARMMNSRFRKATGIDEDVVNVETLTTTAAVELFQDGKALRTRQQQTEQKLANAQIAFSAGYGASAYADTGLSKTEADTAFRKVYLGAKDQVKVLVDNAVLAPDPFVSPSLAGEIRATVQGSIRDQWNPGMENTYMAWKAIQSRANGGEAAAAAYYGTYHAQFKQLDTLVGRGTPVDIAYDRVFNRPVPPNPELTKANTKALEEGIKGVNQYDGWKSLFSWMGVRPLSETGVRGLTSVLAPKFDQFMQINPDASPVETAKWVAQAAVAAGEVEMYGEYAWGKEPNQVALSQYVGPVKAWASDAVESTISAKLKAQGATSVDDYTIWRGPDTAGDPVIYVQALGGGQAWNVVVRGSEIKAVYDATQRRKTTPAQAPAVDWTAPVM